jgi:immunoglobulin-like protein involved in spore germination
MKRLLIFALVLLLAACNLSDQQPGAPTAIPNGGTPATAPQNTATPLPPSNPTRTPTGNDVIPNLPPPTATPGYAPVGVRTQPPSNNPIPTQPPAASGPRGSVTQPLDGATVSGGSIQIAGTAGGIFENMFTVAVVDLSGNTIASQGITLNNPNFDNLVSWSAALSTGNYSGQAEIRAFTASPRDGSLILLGSVHVTIVPGGSGAGGGTANGPTATITSPTNGSTIANGIIQVTGMAGGIHENQFTLSLILPNGSEINSQHITLTSSDPSFIVPWSAALGTNGFTGQMEIRAYTASPRDGSLIVLSSIQVIVQ